jgi:serine/threonine protein kinase
MPAPANVNEFFDLVRKSCVLDEKRLDAYLEKLQAADAVPTEPAKAAGVLVRDGLLTTFQAEQILQGKWRRFTIGKYKVLERLGSGGMGSVYLCEHKLMRRRVAVKVLPTAKASDPSSLERFYREARAVAALDHPNIVHAYDIDQEENLHFLVMEYVDGASLQELVKRSGPLDPVRAAHYLRQAALGLGHANDRGLIHRDIKPGNLLVDRLGTVKVLDMGLARFFNDEEDILTKKYDESVLGTADYLAPEQAVDSHDVDIRADIYSLGATFYYMLTGRTPFGEGTVAQKLIWHQSRQPKAVTAVRPEVPQELAAVLQKMMAKQPAQRYQKPQEVADALAAWTQGTIPPPADSEMPRLSPAAAGTGGSESTAPTTPPSLAGPKTSPRKNWQLSPSPGPRSPVPSSPPPRRVPVAADSPTQTSADFRAALAPAPASAGAPKGEPRTAARAELPAQEEGTPWEIMSADTQTNPISLADTDPRSGRKRHGVTPVPAKIRRQRRRVWWVGGGVSSLFVLGLAFLVWKFIIARPAPPVVPVREPLFVSREALPNKETFRTIQQALARAEPGDRIVLLDERHEENVIVDRQKGQTAITLEVGEGKHVVWTGKRPEEPLLRLYGAQRFHLKGGGLTLDGGGRIKTLVVLSLRSAGLELEGARLQGFTGPAIEVINCAGDAANPVVLKGLDIKGTDKPAQAAVAFDAKPSITSVPLNHDIIVTEDCKFEGLPKRPVQVKDAKVNGANVQYPAPPMKNGAIATPAIPSTAHGG